MGKSWLLSYLALQDMDHGHGVFVLDPHAGAARDSAIETILKRLPTKREKDVLLFDVRDKTHSFGINLVACEDPSDLNAREDAYEKAYEVFHSLWPEDFTRGVWLEKIVTYLLRAFIENQEKGKEVTLADAPRFLRDSDPAFRKRVVANIRYHSQTADFWQNFFTARRPQDQAQEIEAALTRFDILLASQYIAHVIGQRETTLDFSQMMQERKIILVSFSANLPPNTKRFLGTILVRELLWAARARRGDYSQFCVFVDEFQNFVTTDFAEIIRETRKFGIAPTLAQQYISNLASEAVNEAIEAMANIVLFRPTIKDAERKAKEFADRPEPARLEVLEEEERVVLEEERREVLEEERVDRFEEEIEDGIEPVRAPKGDIVGHLLKQPHPDPRVGVFVEKYVEANPDNPWFNKLLYAGMARPEMIFFPLPQETLQSILPDNQFIRLLFEQNTDGSLSQAINALRNILDGLDAYLADAASWQPNMSAIDYQQKTLEYFSQFDLKAIGRSVLVQTFRPESTEE